MVKTVQPAPLQPTKSVGRGVTFKVEDGVLIIFVDISDEAIEAAPDSVSGKTKSVASTGGNVEVGHEGLKFGLNVYKKQ